MGIDLNDFKQNSIISENLHTAAEQLPERPELVDSPQYS